MPTFHIRTHGFCFHLWTLFPVFELDRPWGAAPATHIRDLTLWTWPSLGYYGLFGKWTSKWELSLSVYWSFWLPVGKNVYITKRYRGWARRLRDCLCHISYENRLACSDSWLHIPTNVDTERQWWWHNCYSHRSFRLNFRLLAVVLGQFWPLWGESHRCFPLSAFFLFFCLSNEKNKTKVVFIAKHDQKVIQVIMWTFQFLI